MTTIGTRQLRASLAECVQRAEAGERFTVTVGGRPVAQLGPIESAHRLRPETMEEAARLGLIEQPAVVGPDAASSMRLPGGLDRFPTDVRVDRILRQVRG